jgi:hypothetical protein
MDGTMKNKQLPELIWYGERGIINSVLTHMQQSRAGFVEELKRLINAIQWAEEKPANWATIAGTKKAQLFIKSPIQFY